MKLFTGLFLCSVYITTCCFGYETSSASLSARSPSQSSASYSRGYSSSSTLSSPITHSKSSGQSEWGNSIIPAAIQTYHSVEYRDYPIEPSNINPTVIEVGSRGIPLTILFRSSSSTLNVQQTHQGAAGTNQETSSEDEPHILRHSVKKPIYQEVHEIISPYRKIFQKIEPVQEEIRTIVARGQHPTNSSQNLYSGQKMRYTGGGNGGGSGTRKKPTSLSNSYNKQSSSGGGNSGGKARYNNVPKY